MHPSYLGMQYPLLFPYGEDGYRTGILMRGQQQGKRGTLSMRQFFSFRIQQRKNEFTTILLGKKLFQQFLVDSYTMIEAQWLSFVRNNQKNLRADMYKGLMEAILRGETNPSLQGKRAVVLCWWCKVHDMSPSTFEHFVFESSLFT